jgi:hypothetical protein
MICTLIVSLMLAESIAARRRAGQGWLPNPTPGSSWWHSQTTSAPTESETNERKDFL